MGLSIHSKMVATVGNSGNRKTMVGRPAGIWDWEDYTAALMLPDSKKRWLSPSLDHFLSMDQRRNPTGHKHFVLSRVGCGPILVGLPGWGRLQGYVWEFGGFDVPKLLVYHYGIPWYKMV
jgi:hypothetical protein